MEEVLQKMTFPKIIKMPRLLILILAALFTAPAVGELKVIESPDNPTHTTYQLSITPAAEPDPVFTHRLVLQDIDLLEGNAASYYYRALQNISREYAAVVKEFGGDEFDIWQDAKDSPLSEVPRENAAKAIGYFENKSLERATQTRTCDWGLDISSLSGDEYIGMQLEEFQWSRTLARVLALRARLSLAERNNPAALADIRRIYRLAQDVAKPPFLVCGLIGSAAAEIANSGLVEFIAQPQAPNLYWALGELPDPLIDYQLAAQMELNLGWKLAPFLRNAETTERSPEEWNALWQSLAKSQLQNFINEPPSTLRSGEVGLAALGFASYSHAKQRLLAWRFAPEKVEAMAVGQVLAIYSARVFQQRADRQERMFYVSWPEARKILADLDTVDRSEAIWNNPDREVIPLAAETLRSSRIVRYVQERTRRQIAALRVIEALRMHAAEHDGQLPATLAEVSCVPVPDNPATGEPFLYQLDGATAVLELPASDGLNNSARYEITVGR